MQESDRQMLMEFWLLRLLEQGSRPLCYARTGESDALVAFLLPVAEQYITDAECQISLNPGPPCEIEFEFVSPEQTYQLQLAVDGNCGCRPEDLLLAAQQVDRFWLFIGPGTSQSITLYEVDWRPQTMN
ncbi:MAG: hypothetical protein ACM3NT_08035 [Methylocystaceae bacterium]